METFLERYRNGEYTNVWAELVGLGPDVRKEPFRSDAKAVSFEMMTRARHNIKLLMERLPALGYRFLSPQEIWIPPDEKVPSTLNKVEECYGPLPVVIRAWCEIVGFVNFMGAHPKLSQCADNDWGGSDRLPCYGDPIFIWILGPHNQDLIPYYLNRAGSKEEEAEMEAKNPHPLCLEVGMSMINKAGQSGGGGVDMLVPNPAFDAPLIDSDSFWTGTFFVPYLRECFQWGGFPGLRGGWFPGQEWNPEYSRAELNILTKDLRPL
jgi:hypothetical protein